MSSRRRPPPLVRRTFVVGRIAGIEIAVHVTWFAIFAGLTVAARYGIVPDVAPRASGVAAALLSIAFALVFYSFVLAHELSHALVARAYGLQARRITLFFFGGVAQIGSEARDPGEEFRVAIAGPLMSLVLAGILAAVSRLLHPGTEGFPGLWGAFAAINLALGLFNLVPGFPLDGGRILRSALWAGMGDRARATRWSAFGGKLVAFGLMGSGAAFLLFGQGAGRGAVPGLWGLMLGWFLYGMAGGAASTEGAATPAAVPDRSARVAPPVNLAVSVTPVTHGTERHDEIPAVREDPREAALRLDRVLFGEPEETQPSLGAGAGAEPVERSRRPATARRGSGAGGTAPG